MIMRISRSFFKRNFGILEIKLILFSFFFAKSSYSYVFTLKINSGSLIVGSTGTFLSGIRVIMACQKQSNMPSDTLTSRS